MAGLNTVEIDEMVDLIKRIRARGVTLLVIEHVMSDPQSFRPRHGAAPWR